MEEREYLEQYNPNDFERPSVAVDLLVFTMEGDRLKIVLVEREEHPFKNKLSLPGVFVGIKETLDEAATRGITEETGLKDIYFEQLYTWGDVNRDPRMRIISVSYIAIVDVEQIQLSAGARTASVALYDVEELLASDAEGANVRNLITKYNLKYDSYYNDVDVLNASTMWLSSNDDIEAAVGLRKRLGLTLFCIGVAGTLIVLLGSAIFLRRVK